MAAAAATLTSQPTKRATTQGAAFFRGSKEDKRGGGEEEEGLETATVDIDNQSTKLAAQWIRIWLYFLYHTYRVSLPWSTRRYNLIT